MNHHNRSDNRQVSTHTVAFVINQKCKKRVKMVQDSLAEIKKKLLETPFYRPLIGSSHMVSDFSHCTTYSFNGTDAVAQQLYDPLPSSSASSAFEETVITRTAAGKVRFCQLCGIQFLNSKHSHMWKDNNTCCVCKVKFATDEALKQHNDETLKAGKCCWKNCSIPITDDMDENMKHLKKHK